jgi:tetratricopeptide (TPR) repeat protein
LGKKTNVATLMRQGEELLTQERFQEAAQTYEYIILSFPESPVQKEARYRLAVCYHQLNQPSKTVRTLRPLVGLDLPTPRKVKILSLMAESYLNLKKPLHTLRWYLMAVGEADDPEVRAELKERIRHILSEDLSLSLRRESRTFSRKTFPTPNSGRLFSSTAIPTWQATQNSSWLNVFCELERST